MKRIFIIIAFVTSGFLTVFGQSQQGAIRPKIQALVERLEKEKALHLGLPVGFSGTSEAGNKYYKLYKTLGNRATNEELVFLTNDNNKTIVLYAFDILSSRGHSGLKEIFLKHITDTSEVWLAAGCTGSLVNVNLFMLRYLDPALLPFDKGYLSKTEYDDYIDLIEVKSKP